MHYAKNKSNTIAKLDGTYRPATTNTNAVTTTDLQQQIFAAPGSKATAPTEPHPPVHVNGKMDVDTREEDAKGVKRGREEESDQEIAMDEDSDATMEEGSDEDD